MQMVAVVSPAAWQSNARRYLNSDGDAHWKEMSCHGVTWLATSSGDGMLVNIC